MRTGVCKLQINECTRYDCQHQCEQLLEVCHFRYRQRFCHVGTWRCMYRVVVLGQADENEFRDVVTRVSELCVYVPREEDEGGEDGCKGEEVDDLKPVRHKVRIVTLLAGILFVYVVCVGGKTV